MKKVFIVVPAYNEEATIVDVINDLEKHDYKDIVVVDDGSEDQTGSVAKKPGAIVLTHVINRGLGAALGTGFAYARKNGADIVVTFDADGQHRAQDIKKLLAPIISGKVNAVIGSRMLGSRGMPWDRIMLNFLANLLTYLFYGVWTTDSQSGLRAFSRKAITAIEIKTDRMEVSSEFFKEIKRNHLRFVEVPIDPIYSPYSRQKGQGNWNSVSVGIKMLLSLFR